MTNSSPESRFRTSQVLKKRRMKQVKVYIEMSKAGYSAYMEEAGLDYGCIGEGKTVEEAIDDFRKSYAGIREYYERHGKYFEEVTICFVSIQDNPVTN